MTELRTDVLVVGGGLGGVAAALAVARAGRDVVVTEETDWIGGQLTAQAVPPDEHPWIERFGSTAAYRRLRDGIREHYRRWYPLTAAAAADPHLNPGRGSVSALCHEPTVALAVLDAMLAPYRADGRLRTLLRHRPTAVTTDGDEITSVTLLDTVAGGPVTVTARYVLDATETGELLPLAGVEYVTGTESAAHTGEPSAPDTADPQAMQGFTVCMALDHRDGEDHTVDRPSSYTRWLAPGAPVRPAPQIGWGVPAGEADATRTLRPNPDAEGDRDVVVSASHRGRFAPPAGWSPIEDLWRFRRLLARHQFAPALSSDVTLVNWSANDYIDGSLVDVDAQEAARNLQAARELSLSLLYWLQTEAPRPDGGTGFPGLRPRGDITGTPDGLAKAPYIRESRRIQARYTVVEQDVSPRAGAETARKPYIDTIGIGSYKLDLHPSTHGAPRMYAQAHPFQIPLGALLPRRMRNLLAAAKNIGTTHITNGCYRVHPVEWNIGESAGLLAAHCLDERTEPQQVHEDPDRLARFQSRLTAAGVELHWPHVRAY